MSLAHTPDRMRLPQDLEHQLHDFRRLVWTVKIVEAVAGACFGILAAYLVLFGLDRLWDTPAALRGVVHGRPSSRATRIIVEGNRPVGKRAQFALTGTESP